MCRHQQELLLVGLWTLVLSLFNQDTLARQSEGDRKNSLLLNGRWEFVIGDGSEEAYKPEGQSGLSWKLVTLPGPLMPWSHQAATQTKIVWARRTFHLSAEQAHLLAVLRWNRIANGAEAFINGQKVGENEPTGPYQVIIPAGVLRPGENQIVLKIRGAAAVRRSRSGNALIPAGFGVGMPEVSDDIWIDFANKAYMKWVLAIPDLAGKKVRIRVTPVARERIESLTILAEVRPWPPGEPLGRAKGSARAVATSDPLDGEHFFVDVPMPNFRPWTPEDCALYQATVQLLKGEELLDEVTFRFGMREFTLKDGHFYLNGKRIWLRGSNLVFEWNWGDVVRGREKEYLVLEAREMSMNSFRTHTQPPPRLWCDIADEFGTMILAEFPVLYNYQDYRFTPEEYEIWHRNVLTDVAGWMARLWNHPSVIIWVLSNESNVDNAWEEGPYRDFVKSLDATRPTLRTGNKTKEIYDVHACGNITETDEGHLLLQIPGWFEAAGERVLTVTEYMNDFGHPRTQWTGVDSRLANDLAVAQIGGEHTEAMRRARIAGIWPYMYAGWTRVRQEARVRETGQGSAVWKAGYASPLSACWHSTLSPVLASLELFDPNYRTGEEVTTRLHLINDSWHEANVTVDILLTREPPEWIPEADCFNRPVAAWHYEFQIPADTVKVVPIRWKLPETEGSYWVTARLTGIEGRPVLSQRFIRAASPPRVSAELRRRRFLVLGQSEAAERFFDRHDLTVVNDGEELRPNQDLVVIWDAEEAARQKALSTRTLRTFLEQGGTILVLATRSWPWPELCDVTITPDPRFSRVFPHPAKSARWFPKIDPQWLIRWNGLPGTVAFGKLAGPGMEKAEKILWAKEPAHCVMAAVRPKSGVGRLVFCQLDLQRRVDLGRQNYDPVAEKVLLALLSLPVQE
ncbi:MAG: hypothetical protein NZ899_00750 [Thermoguttaceae bacterium]|nr:hypothetical protein [Thermoguttaceae bacterium]MDW8077424.1 glycoside hydrolase family 2 TIM barrel-domain containing protein [Thermoguttaceae bacterium]